MVDIYWDKYDVPHIYSQQISGLFYGCGRAVMRNHANLVLKLYAEARGQASRYMGSSSRASDLLMIKLGVWERAKEWYALQTPDFRLLLEHFVQGVNDYGAEHAETIDRDKQGIFPISVEDVIAHYQRVFHITMMVDFEQLVASLMNSKLKPGSDRFRGSNAWALSSSKALEGHPILMSSPHLPWGDMFRLFEVHLSSPELNLYGVAPVGIPVLTMAFNDHLGWTHTVNKFQGWTLYELDLKPGGYLFDDKVIPFSTLSKSLQILDQSGELQEETVTVRSSVHGPVIWAADGKAYALRIAGLNNPKGLEQWWKMACAHNLHEFQFALKRMQIPTLNVVYSDRDGHIMYFFNCQLPVVSPIAAPTPTVETVSGITSSSMWTQTYKYNELPGCVDPPSGWLQNTNDPPWTCTMPPVLDADRFPASISNRDTPLSLRSQQSIQVLDRSKKMSFDQVVEGRASRRAGLADLLLDQLLYAVTKSGDMRTEEAASVLKAWDRTIDFSSMGAVLFAYWSHLMDQQNLLPQKIESNGPSSEAYQLVSPELAVSTLATAANIVRASFGALDVSWSTAFLLADEDSSPGKSALFSEDMLGVLSELWYVPCGDGRFKSVGGECFAFVVQFAQPIRASAILLYGNKTQDTVGGRPNQFDLYRAKKMRPVLSRMDQLEGQVAHHESFQINTTYSATGYKREAYEKSNHF